MVDCFRLSSIRAIHLLGLIVTHSYFLVLIRNFYCVLTLRVSRSFDYWIANYHICFLVVPPRTLLLELEHSIPSISMVYCGALSASRCQECSEHPEPADLGGSSLDLEITMRLHTIYICCSSEDERNHATFPDTTIETPFETGGRRSEKQG